MYVINFYLFSYLDIVPLLIITALVLGLYTITQWKWAYSFHTIAQLLRFGILIALGALIGYCNGFRYMFLSSYNTPLDASLPHIISQLIPLQWDIESIAKKSYEYLLLYTHKDTAALIIALSMGIKEYIHLAFLDIVRRNGISHLLALSGFHLSIVIVGGEYVGKLLQIIRRKTVSVLLTYTLCIAIVWTYCIFIGFIPSLYRAALMYTLSKVLMRFFGASSFMSTWSLTGILLSLLVPSVMYSHGFILSMLALLGVQAGVRMSRYVSKTVPVIIASAFTIGIGASAMTTWYSYVFFGSSYPIGILMSVILTPIVTVFMVMGIILLCTSLITHSAPIGIVSLCNKGIGIVLDTILEQIQSIISYTAHLIEINTIYGLVWYYGILSSGIMVYMLLFHKRMVSEYIIYRLLPYFKH